MTFTRTTALALSSVALLAVAACGRNEAKKEPAPVETPPPVEAPAMTEPMVGGVAMNPMDTIVANASKAPNLTTQVSAIQAAGLAERLQGPGPFTVFAPDNAAFDKIPAATREGLMQPAQKAELTKILTYHVVPGRLTAADLAAEAQKGGGTATLTTVQGEKLMAKDMGGGKWELTDAKGGKAMVTQADVAQSNGMVHVIDTVLMPK
ncbi:fasciclin domain-containing protein [Brevundimonas naejangsanensis]|uniref:Fasciclin domain-containing protein n=1 Tax=Brevundimonas naejangsanensis TaxID=588932 RepID=A0A494RPG0_9CAUL|nr:fasciclin domain-containing protein [Brevundimonas naejangsanensis]AYG95246.1 fasciclin domain-containing protein [Brevundimonas naejangsanensis]